MQGKQCGPGAEVWTSALPMIVGLTGVRFGDAVQCGADTRLRGRIQDVSPSPAWRPASLRLLTWILQGGLSP